MAADHPASRATAASSRGSTPRLNVAGGSSRQTLPCRAVAELIPGARFEVMDEEAHQPFQELPDQWNARVDTFWREVEARG